MRLTLHIKRLPEVSVGFHKRGQCWRVFARPRCERYYAGHMYWFGWWRFYLVVDFI